MNEKSENTVFVNTDMQETVSDLDKLYLELGKAYYEGGFEDPLPQLLPIFDRITSCLSEERKDRISDTLKSDEIQKSTAVYCKTCGTKIPENAKFCPICGTATKM